MKTIIENITRIRFVLLSLILFNTLNAISQINSPLSQGNWYKFSIDQSGVYKLDYNFLTISLKIPSADLKTSKLGVFGYGGGVLPEYSVMNNNPLKENNIEIVDKNSNGQIDIDDYILFYGAAPFAKSIDNSSGLLTHTSAFYSDVQHFFFTTTEGSGKSLQNASPSSNPIKLLNSFDYLGINDRDSINPFLSGRVWYSQFISNSRRTITLNLPTEQCIAGEKIIVSYAYLTRISGAILSISVNGSAIKSFSISPTTYSKVDTFSMICPGSESTISFTVNGAITENFYLDYVTVNAKSNLNYSGKQFDFRFKDDRGTGNKIQFNLSGANNAKVWDVTNIGAFKAITTRSYVFENAASMSEFVVFEDGNAYTPKAIGKIPNQNLLGLGSASNIIIAPKDWISVAKELAAFHKQERGIESHVVDIEEVYNDYSSGNKDVTAIRRFAADIYYKTSPSELKTLTLFGKACVDYKGVNKQSDVCQDFIPTYETLHSVDYSNSFPTDDIFGLLGVLDTNLYDTDKSLSIGVGRIPVISLTEAKEILAKIKAYKKDSSYGDWRNQYASVSDDYDNPEDADFYIQNENVNRYLADNHIKILPNKLYLDAFSQQQFSGGQRYEDAEKLLKDNFTFGNLLITYIGHGGESNWTQERILSSNDLPIYKNLYSLPFVTTATCGFAPYDKPNGSNKSAGEKYLLQKDGGAIGLLTTCREVYISDQGSFMAHFIESFFDRSNLTFGEIARQTKNKNNLNNNSQKVVLLADPALELNIPKYNVVTTSISNGTSDTLKSLSKVKITGEVRNLSNAIMTDFNGFCQITVLDKAKMNRLNYNDRKDPPIPNDTFFTQQSRIFRGSTSVKDGKFSIEFIVPKDINYVIGRGKIAYYAADITQKPYRDASGMDTNVIIGGANLTAIEDNTPPKVDLYMNDEKFAFGGLTNADPVLLVKLFDSSGINTTGAGIGHDITAILDDNQRIPINLNSYYRTEQDNFMRGRIAYPMYKLKDGKHTIKVKAWDVYNNPGEGYTEFIVASSEKIALSHVLNYPNPFTTHTRFEFEHNRPNEPLDVSINVMTITGKVVKRFYQKIVTEGYRVQQQFPWNGLDDYGDKIGRGIYIYSVTIRDSKGETANKYEKLVLLQ